MKDERWAMWDQALYRQGIAKIGNIWLGANLCHLTPNMANIGRSRSLLRLAPVGDLLFLHMIISEIKKRAYEFQAGALKQVSNTDCVQCTPAALSVAPAASRKKA